MANSKKGKGGPIMSAMPTPNTLEKGKNLFNGLVKLLSDNGFVLIFDPDDYGMRFGPAGLHQGNGQQPPLGNVTVSAKGIRRRNGKKMSSDMIPYTAELDEEWDEKYSLGVEWGEFDPDNFDDLDNEDDYDDEE